MIVLLQRNIYNYIFNRAQAILIPFLHAMLRTNNIKYSHDKVKNTFVLYSLYFRRGSLSRDFLSSRQVLLCHRRLRHLPGPLSPGSHGGHPGVGRQQIQREDEKTLLQQRPAGLGHVLSQ